MSQIKRKIEKRFEKIGLFIYRNPFKVLLLSFIFVGFLLYQIPKTTVDTSAEGLLHENDSSMVTYKKFQDQFGLSNFILITVPAPEKFDEKFLTKLKSLHDDLEDEVPYIRDVTSFVNARNVYGKGDILYVEKYLKDWPERDVDMASLKKNLMKNPVYVNNIISEDGQLVAIVLDVDPDQVPLEEEEDYTEGFEDSGTDVQGDTKKKYSLKGEEVIELVSTIKKVIKRYEGPDFRMTLAGGPVTIELFNRYMLKDLRIMITLGLCTINIFLLFLFRRLSGIIYPFIIVTLAMLSSLGLMALFNVSLSTITTALPAFLLAVGIADSVHILAIFYRQFEETDSKEEAISYALGHTGLAIFLTSSTTAAGLLSFSFSEIADIAEMGIFSAAGVMLALFYTIIMLPAFIAIFPIKHKKKTARDEKKKKVF
jgi:uncharacterized protein